MHIEIESVYLLKFMLLCNPGSCSIMCPWLADVKADGVPELFIQKLKHGNDARYILLDIMRCIVYVKS